ncbi:MAG: 4Fe-4S dicluster domain-containing protein [Candidatus Saganbacteria bacterium]|nr:4Fe-4S dicluster domain-containing protein [Candidatus Saganbacteria bacterium]
MVGHFISIENLEALVKELLKTQIVYAPVPHVYNENTLTFSKINTENLGQIVLNKFRTVDSPKQFIYKLLETVSQYFGDKEYDIKAPALVLLGVKACDLSAIEVLSRVFGEGEFKDAFYQKRRDNLLIISSDCDDATPNCFCTLVGGKPYPEKGYDLNLSPLEDGYAVDIGSPKGEAFVSSWKKFFTDLSLVGRNKQEDNRQAILEKVEEINKEYSFKSSLDEIHKKSLDTSAWKEITKTCVECSACNRVCPSCTCFLLLDQGKSPNLERLKVWDFCLQSSYTKVAGGANPRGKLSQRLENRYECKFNYSYERLGRYTCVGCGRCIECCMGNIDMRKAFKIQEKAVLLGAKLK